MKASMRCCPVAMHFTGPPIKLRASFLKRWASCQLVSPSRPPLWPTEVLSVLQFFLEQSEPQGLALLGACRRLRIPRRWGCPPQSPAPGFGKKYWSLSGFPSHSLESAGGAFLTVIFGQIFAYSAFSDSHFSSPGSVSALIASTGHSGSHTPQSMHSSGWMTSMFPLCVPKIRFCNIGDEDRQGQVAM